jgi:hypothetical protein
LRFENNQLTGTIPFEWDNMSRINSFGISGNEITGEVNPVWCRLERQEHKHFYFDCHVEDFHCCSEYEDPSEGEAGVPLYP